LGKAKLGAKAPAEAFGALSKIIGKDIVAASRQGGDALPLIADGMAKITDTSKQAAIATTLMGKGGAALVPLLSGGSEAINGLALAAEKLGIILSDEQIANADKTADKLEAVRTVLASQIAGVVANNAQAIIQLADSLVYLVSAAAQAAAKMTAFYRSIAIQGARFVHDHPTVAKIAFGTKGSEKILRAGVGAIRANIADKAPPKQSAPRISGGADIGQFLAPKGGGGRKGRTPRAPRDRSDDVEFQFDQELKRAHADVLRAQQSLAKTFDERAKIALQLLDAEREMQEAELQDRVRRAERDLAEGKITAGALEQVKAQAEKLRAEYDSVDALQRKAIIDDLAAEKARDAADLVDAGYDLQLEKLQLEGSLAEETDERLDVELRILALAKEQEKARLEAVIADKDASETAKEIAKARLAELDAIYAGKADAARQGNRSPLQDYKARYSDVAQENEEAFVNMLEGVSDALSKATDGLKELKESLLDTFKTFFQTLLKNQLNQLFASLIPSGGIRLPGFATGGSIMVGGHGGIDRNLLSLNGMPIARVSYGERVNVSNDNSRGQASSRGDTIVNVNGVRDFDSFRRNERQVGRSARRALGI
jgi:hypothetical protein